MALRLDLSIDDRERRAVRIFPSSAVQPVISTARPSLRNLAMLEGIRILSILRQRTNEICTLDTTAAFLTCAGCNFGTTYLRLRLSSD